MLKKTLAALALLAACGPCFDGARAADDDECECEDDDGCHGAGFAHISDKHLKIAVHPICPTPISYMRYWPTYWYGQPIPANAELGTVPPMIYMPTDTTQMGFYYQRVPHWHARYNMLPPPPNPLQWMSFSCRNGNGNGCRGSQAVPAGQNGTSQPGNILPQPEAAPIPMPQMTGNVFGTPGVN